MSCRSSVFVFVVLAAFLIYTPGETCAQSWIKKSSVDTEWIVFTSGRTGSGDIYAVQAGTGETVRVAGTSSPEASVRYDSFRDRIVYCRHEDRRSMVVSDGRDLFEHPGGDVSPVWSPDGWRIAYAAERGGREDLFIARSNGTREKRLTDDPEKDRHPAWSPDGNRIVFARHDTEGWDLFTLDLRDLPPVPKRLTGDGVFVAHPAWSSDGRYIAFDTVVDEQREVAVLELESGKITKLTDRAGDDVGPAWSLDGRRLAFGGQPDSTGNRDIWTVEIETKDLKRVTSHRDFDGWPVVVPVTALTKK